ncbi:GGDEF domain-containing protein [Butyrivibrio sp. MC2013]|uniref:GGDEF domain-containing protein n=1 Tax=Butyrivibrio sp. MC2013 TaxID=1280686 RepID=UPI00040EC5E5|nr:GGDEF domain-containing protein [Butyrivibrio sp. MC2013]
MNNNGDIFKGVMRRKVCGLIIEFLTAVFSFIMILTDAPLRESIYRDRSFTLLCGVLLLVLVVSFLLGIADLRHINDLQRESIKFKKMLYLDPLTNLPNRYSFDRYLERFDDPDNLKNMCLTLISIDNLALANMEGRTDAGDRLMEEFGHIVNRCVSDGSFACRNGGNEFLIVSDKGRSASPYETMAMLCESIKEYNILHPENRMIIKYNTLDAEEIHPLHYYELIAAAYSRFITESSIFGTSD